MQGEMKTIREMPWIIACDGSNPKYPWGFKCERCGEHEPLPKQLPIDAYLKWAESFVSRHKGCREANS